MNGRLTITEVAERVGVTTRTIRRWEAKKRLKKQKEIGEAGGFMTMMTLKK